MARLLRFRLVVLFLLGVVPSLHAQRVRQVRILQASAESFRFEPSRVNARPGDVLEFVVVSGGPYVIGFEAKDLSETDRTMLDEAIPERSGPLRGPVLAGKGSRLRILLPGITRGAYRFVSIPHLAYRLGGVLVIE